MKSYETLRTFENTHLLDGYSEVESRSDVELGFDRYDGEIKGWDGRAPIIPIFVAPMLSTDSPALMDEIMEAGFCYVKHRYCSLEERFAMWRDHHYDDFNTNPLQAGVAIGIHDDVNKLKELVKGSVVSHLCLDVAAAHNKQVVQFLKSLVASGIFDNNPDLFLTVGNVTSYTFILTLEKEGLLKHVDFVKVGQGGGSVCTTRNATGVGLPTLENCARFYEGLQRSSLDVKIIADGGIRTPGDMAKCFGLGASGVMCGSIFAGHDECPYDIVDGRKVYHHFGMASAKAKTMGDKELRHIEGTNMTIPPKGPVKRTVSYIKESLQSSLSMQGFDNLSDYIGNASYIVDK